MPKPRYHAAVSLALAGLVVARRRRWQAAWPILVAGVLVDLDHLVDLIVNRAVARAGQAGPADPSDRDPAGQRFIILPLHAWEWVLGLVLHGSQVSLGMAGGLATHLVLDQLNRAIRHPLFYWFGVRAAYGFRAIRPLVEPERLKIGSRWMRQSPLHWV